MREEGERGRHDRTTRAGDKSRGRKSRAGDVSDERKWPRRKEERESGGGGRGGDFKDRQRIEDRTTRHERRSAKNRSEQGGTSTCTTGEEGWEGLLRFGRLGAGHAFSTG